MVEAGEGAARDKMMKLHFAFKLQNKRKPETWALRNPVKYQEGGNTLPRTCLKSLGGCSWQQAWDVLLKIEGDCTGGKKLTAYEG